MTNFNMLKISSDIMWGGLLLENAFVAPMNDSGSEVVGKAVGSRCVNVRGRAKGLGQLRR